MPSPLPILTYSSFTGEWFIPMKDATAQAEMTACIAEHEPKYLRKMFGVELYDSYISDSTVARFTALSGGFVVEDSAEVQYTSDGFAAMLKGFIYFEFLSKRFQKVTSNGIVKSTSEASETVPASVSLGMLRDRFNKAVDTYRATQWYMESGDDAEDYPEFTGKDISKMFWF